MPIHLVGGCIRLIDDLLHVDMAIFNGGVGKEIVKDGGNLLIDRGGKPEYDVLSSLTGCSAEGSTKPCLLLMPLTMSGKTCAELLDTISMPSLLPSGRASLNRSMVDWLSPRPL